MAYPPKGPDDYAMAGFRAVTPSYFAALGVPLRAGRLLTDRDRRGAPRVVIINETMPKQFFPDRPTLGERIQLGTDPSPWLPTREIVGVVGDVKRSFSAGSNTEMFVLYGQYPDPILSGTYSNAALVVRAAGDPEHAISSVRSVVHHVDPAQPLVNGRTMEAAMATRLRSRAFRWRR